MNEEPKENESRQEHEHSKGRLPYNVSHSRTVAILDIRATVGEAIALPYCYLEMVQFDPSTALVLTFATCEVRIEGHKLWRLYEDLVQHAVESIHENDAKYDEADEKRPFIARIEIKPLAPETKLFLKGFDPERESLDERD